MSVSLDGFVAGPNERVDNGLGDGGERLHEWVFGDVRVTTHHGADPDGVNGRVFREVLATGAVVAGRGTFEPAGGWGGDHHDGVPVFILSRQRPENLPLQFPGVTYLPDVTVAMEQAKRTAGDRNVLVHGVTTARLALAAGVLDEVALHVVPVLLGEGRHLFGGLGPQHIELERTRVLEGEGGVTHLHYRVVR
jgi:dihydrofolate reductase